MRKFFRELCRKAFWPYERSLEKEVRGCKSLLDLGCGYPSPIKPFSSKLYSVGVDLFGPSIEKSRIDGIHNEYYQEDILEIDRHIRNHSFDCVLASDVIEHLEKEDGIKLLELMERLAKKRVVVFTPNGFLPQPAHGENVRQRHLSGWTVSEMKRRGYRAVGMNGWKPLRIESAALKFKPTPFWLLISDITQLVTRWFPEIAFQVLYTKDINSKKRGS